MNSTDLQHDWFREHLEAYLAGGLTTEERRKLEAHASLCAACDAALVDARKSDDAFCALFADVAPTDLDERLIASLRNVPPQRRIIPITVWRLATGIAAAVVLAGFGFLGNRILDNGKLPSFSLPKMAWLSPTTQRVKTGSNLRQIGQAQQLYSNENLDSAGTAEGMEARNSQSAGWARESKGRKETIEDLSDSVQLRGEHFDAQLGGARSKTDGEARDYDDVLRHPADWPKLSKEPGAVVSAQNWDGRAPANLWNIQNGAQTTFTADNNAPGVSSQSKIQLPEQLAKERDFGLAWFDDSTSVKGKDAVATDGKAKLRVITTAQPAESKPTDVALFGRADTSTNLVLGVNKSQGRNGRGDGQGNGMLTMTGGAVASDHENAGAPGNHIDTYIVSSDKTDATVALGKTSPSQSEYFGYAPASHVAKAPEPMYYKPADAKPQEQKETQVADASKKLYEQAGAKPEAVAMGNKGMTLGDSNEDGTLGEVDVKRRSLALAKTEVAAIKETEVTEKQTPVLGAKGEQERREPASTQAAQRKIIRNGQMEFEVDSFDSSFMQISKIVAEEAGQIASTDSEKLPNGKVKGTITLRVPPDHLDVLVLKLRGLGDLKTQRISAQDVTKQYTDFASQLRAARTMEERLLEIIKSGKGEVKDLVEAEKQLGVYREKIEQIEGELRYYDSLVSLSTLNVTLFERDIKTPTAAFETESVNAGIETEDVEKARADALKAIDDAKGRVIESNLKKLDAGQLAATIVAEVSPEAAGPLTDRLKQLGRVVRMEAERKQTTQGGTGAPIAGIKTERRATKFNISLYNLANIAPRETVNITLAATDVKAAYESILTAMRGDAADAAKNVGELTPIGRVVSSSLTSPKPDQTSGAISLEVRSNQIATIETVIRGLGDVMTSTVAENPDANNVTRAKRGYSISLLSVSQVPARETQTLTVAAKSVPAAYNKLLGVLQNPKQPARILSSQLNEQDRQNINATIDVEIPRVLASAVETALANGTDSDIISRNVTRSNDAQNTLDTKLHVTVTLGNADRLPARESTMMAIEVSDVEKAINDAVSAAANGRVVEKQESKQQNGRVSAHVVLDVPLTSAPALLDHLNGLGTVRVRESTKNQAVPEGLLARARFDLTLGEPARLVSADDGVSASLREGLRKSYAGLAFSAMLIVIGVCLVGPFVLVAWIAWKMIRRGRARPATAAAI